MQGYRLGKRIVDVDKVQVDTRIKYAPTHREKTRLGQIAGDQG